MGRLSLCVGCRTCSLLVTDSFDRIHRGCFASREEAEKDTDNGANGKTEEDAPHGYADRQIEVGAQQRAEPTDNDAEHAARDTNHNTLDEELIADVDTACAHRHAESDLLGALRNGDKHDIHNADAGHNERESGSHDENNGNGVHGT